MVQVENDNEVLVEIHRKFLGKMLMDARRHHQTDDIFICPKCKGRWINAIQMYNGHILFWFNTKDDSTHILKYSYDSITEGLKQIV